MGTLEEFLDDRQTNIESQVASSTQRLDLMKLKRKMCEEARARQSPVVVIVVTPWERFVRLLGF